MAQSTSSGFMLENICVNNIDSILTFASWSKDAFILEHDTDWATGSARISEYDMKALKDLAEHLNSMEARSISFYMFDSQPSEFSQVLVRRRMDILKPILEEFLPDKKLDFKVGVVVWSGNEDCYSYEMRKKYENKLWVALL